MFGFFGRMLLPLIKQYGTIGVGIANFLLLLFVSWKFACNHFKHLTEKIDANTNMLVKVYKKSENNAKDVAFIKGQLAT